MDLEVVGWKVQCWDLGLELGWSRGKFAASVPGHATSTVPDHPSRARAGSGANKATSFLISHLDRIGIYSSHCAGPGALLCYSFTFFHFRDVHRASPSGSDLHQICTSTCRSHVTWRSQRGRRTLCRPRSALSDDSRIASQREIGRSKLIFSFRSHLHSASRAACAAEHE